MVFFREKDIIIDLAVLSVIEFSSHQFDANLAADRSGLSINDMVACWASELVRFTSLDCTALYKFVSSTYFICLETGQRRKCSRVTGQGSYPVIVTCYLENFINVALNLRHLISSLVVKMSKLKSYCFEYCEKHSVVFNRYCGISSSLSKRRQLRETVRIEIDKMLHWLEIRL